MSFQAELTRRIKSYREITPETASDVLMGVYRVVSEEWVGRSASYIKSMIRQRANVGLKSWDWEVDEYTIGTPIPTDNHLKTALSEHIGKEIMIGFSHDYLERTLTLMFRWR